MLESLIGLVVVALVLVIIFFVVGIFLPDGKIKMVVGLLFGLILLLYALRQFGLLNL